MVNDSVILKIISCCKYFLGAPAELAVRLHEQQSEQTRPALLKLNGWRKLKLMRSNTLGWRI